MTLPPPHGNTHAAPLLLALICAAGCVPDDSSALTLEQCDNQIDDDGNGDIDCDDARCAPEPVCLAQADCGNEVREGLEFCDGSALAGESCESQGFLAGELGCRLDCAGFDTSACIRADRCGDGVREGPEQCDGTDLGGATCLSQRFAEGTLACTELCLFDESDCSGVNPCGNEVLDPGEVCDGDALAGESCTSLGFRGDGLACNATCDGFDLSSCDVERCGNGVIDPGELCDGALFADGIGCESEGFAGGTPTCNATCDGVITTDCNQCGNDIRDPGEVCDGTALGQRDCALEGFFGGTLACNADCDGYDTSGCSDCGNGTIDEGEDCEVTPCNGPDCTDDPTVFTPTASCFELGYRAGTGPVACGPDCRYDTSDCSGFSECGNGVLDGFASSGAGGADVRLFQELCDPGNPSEGIPAVPFWLVPIDYARVPLAGGCGVLGIGTGDILCTADCALDFSQCAPGEPNFCKVAGWWDDGTVCDACDRIAGEPDPDCAPPPLTVPPTCRGDGPDGEIDVPNTSAPGFRPVSTDYPSIDFESCDGNDAEGLRGQSCASLGFSSGELGCRRDCNFDTSACVSPSCGDAMVEGREACDFGTDAGGAVIESADCAELGLGTGTAQCTDGCLSFNDSGCSG